MSDFESRLIGQQCKSVEMIYYMNICLGFGDVFEESTQHGIRTRHTWEIYSWHGIWRITKSNKVLFGSGNKEAVIEKRYPYLLDLAIERVDYKSFDGDLRIFFTDDVILEIFQLSSHKKPAWSIYGADGRIPLDKPADDYDDSLILANHAKGCFERWGKYLPMDNEKQRCKYCAFYFPLRGASFFWDFGVCTNKLSQYDGKVVNVGGICEVFSDVLPENS